MSNTTTEAKLASLSLEQKASLLTGLAWFSTVGIPEAGISQVEMSDGPHGIRLQQAESLDPTGAFPATCFPPAVALGSTWDPTFAVRVGEALGDECRKEGIDLLLGPGINIKRSPLCGRNFEYFSEDPYISGLFGAAWVTGIQSKGVGASLKHFAVNNQETLRMTTSANVDDRTLHEIYLRAFAHVIKTAKPATVMCSYNRINGIYASQNEWLLTTLLRDKWGYEGLVVSDWGAVVDHVASVASGLDLEMPPSMNGPQLIVDAVKAGKLAEEAVNRSALRAIALAAMADKIEPLESYDIDAHHNLAREVAGRAIVLLKNEGGLLPLDPAASQKIAVVGEFARTARYQGDGSSRVTPNKLDNALDSIIAAAPNATVSFAPGFTIDRSEADLVALSAEAVAIAKDADVVLAFLGLSALDESEGFDREHADIQPEQIALLQELLAVNKNVVLILSNGAMVVLDGWTNNVPAILETWLLGQAGGSATADVLFGHVNPSGRLTETIPLRLEDTPSFLNFPGDYDECRYGEGIFVGYRYYDTIDKKVSYPFGFGLSYTTFAYENVAVSADASGISVSLDVRNTGSRDGHEVVQVYVGGVGSRIPRAKKELRAFQSVAVKAGASTHVTLFVPREDLAYFDPILKDWTVEDLTYRVYVGASVADVRATADVAIAGDSFAPNLSMMSTMGEWFSHPKGGPAIGALLTKLQSNSAREIPAPDSIVFKMMAGFRFEQMMSFMKIEIPQEDLDALLVETNN